MFFVCRLNFFDFSHILCGPRFQLLLSMWLGLVWLGRVNAAGPPTWPDGSLVELEQLGIGTVLITWPVAENNVYQLIGYQVLVAEATGELPSYVEIFDGRGFPSVREFLHDAFTSGLSYYVSVKAWNKDLLEVEYESELLTRTYTVSAPVGLDPTVLATSDYSYVSGVSSELSFQGKHPLSSLDQTIGSVCTVEDDPTCIAGRTFVAYIDNLCQLNSFEFECTSIFPPTTGWGANPWLTTRSETFGAEDLTNTGSYQIDITPTKAGQFALMVQAITPSSVLGVYWDNEEFFGDPVQISTDASIDFDWGTDAITLWSSEFVSVRWLGYIQPEANGNYELQCVANDYCSVWIDDVQYLSSVEEETVCSGGCSVGTTFTFNANQYHRLRVDYVSITGESFVHLKWKEPVLFPTNFVAVPSVAFRRGAFITGSPFALTVAPGAMVGSTSFIYGSDEATNSPFVGKPYQLFVQVNDASGNACSSFSLADAVRVTFTQDATSFTAIGASLDPEVADCVYVVSFTHELTGAFTVAATVNTLAVGNTPFVQTVRSGPPDAVRCVLEDAGPLEVGVAGFDVTIRLQDVYGNDVDSDFDFDSLTIQASFARSTSVITSSLEGCGTRSDFNWIVSCWGSEFRYLDDAQITAQSFVPFSSLTDSVTFESDLSGSFLVISTVASAYAGDHDLLVTFGEDTPVTGEPIVLTLATSTSVVDPGMCLVQFELDSVDDAIAGESDFAALVLIRDRAGNVLSDRDSELVELVVTLVDSDDDETRFPCTYVTNKYYSCAGYPVSEGVTEVSVEVRSERASVVTGTAPSEACQSVAKCGTTACPCSMQREPAVVTVTVELPP